MPYNESLAHRVREQLENVQNVVEKNMMGGLTFMVNDKMCVGVLKDDLMLRINPETHNDVIEIHGCREMTFTGKPMKGFVFIGPEATNTSKELKFWVDIALAFNPFAKSSKKKKT